MLTTTDGRFVHVQLDSDDKVSIDTTDYGDMDGVRFLMYVPHCVVLYMGEHNSKLVVKCTSMELARTLFDAIHEQVNNDDPLPVRVGSKDQHSSIHKLEIICSHVNCVEIRTRELEEETTPIHQPGVVKRVLDRAFEKINECNEMLPPSKRWLPRNNTTFAENIKSLTRIQPLLEKYASNPEEFLDDDIQTILTEIWYDVMFSIRNSDQWYLGQILLTRKGVRNMKDLNRLIETLHIRVCPVIV